MKIAILTLLAVLFGFNTLFGAAETFSNRISGSSITSSGTAPQLSVYDGKYFDMLTNPGWTTDYTNLKVTNKIVLGINPAVAQNNALSGGVTFNLKYWYWNGSGFSTTTVTGIQLTVDYSMTETDIINEINTYTFSNAHRVEVTITSVDGGASFDVNDVYLDAYVDIERNYTFMGTAPSSAGVALSTDNNFVEFHWGSLDGAEWYELEWVHVNDYVSSSASGALASSQVAYNFYRNSTRVVVGSTYYKIPNVFDRGYLVFRVRAIGMTGSAFDKRSEGNWTMGESGVASSLTAGVNSLYISGAYDTGMNWSHQVVYSEDGKRLDGISYTDGLGRTRQSLGMNPVTEQVIVNNAYYGGMGAAVMGDLPTPVESQSLHHLINFNHAVGDYYYGAAHFDNQTDPDAECVYTATNFDLNYGAAKYYSVNNPDKTAENARIPDAAGYPFAKVEYMKDQTGRIRSAGGVGAEFQIGQGHETSVYYDTPDQVEVDRLFGTEAGLATHYQRKITIDANRQAYAEYYDMAGRLVASCLMGAAPDNLDELTTNLSVAQTTPMSSGIHQTETSLEQTQNFQAETDGDYTFDYHLTPSHYQDVECLAGICLDCVYKLKISVIDVNCGDVKFTDEVYINGGTYNSTCNETFPYHLSETVNLVAGPYVLQKSLEIAPEATSEYWCTYVDNNTCLPTYADLFNALYVAEDFSDCDPQPVPDENYEQGCSSLLPMLLADMSPGGQYGQYDITGSIYDASAYPISIYKISNSLPGSGDWKHPAGSGYKDEFGNPAIVELTLVSPGVYLPPISGGVPVLLPNGHYSVDPKYLLNLKDFIELFQDSWAEALLPYHPEYCYWQFCEANTASEDYDTQLNGTNSNSFADACSSGWLAPLGEITTVNVSGIYGDCSTSAGLDPAFQIGGWGSGYAGDAQDQMDNYITVHGVSMSMWDYAIFLANCPGAEEPEEITECVRSAGLCKNFDEVWINFRDMYLAMKKSFYAQAEDDYVSDCDGGVAKDVGEVSPYLNATPRFGYYMDGLSMTTSTGDATTQAADMCAEIAAGFAEEWMGELANCPGILALTATQKTHLQEDLAALCGYSCTYDHPAPATTLPGSVLSFTLPNGGTIGGGDGINEVLALYIPGFTENDLCTELLISSPKPYSAILIETPILDKCGCDILLEINQEYTALAAAENLPAGVETIEQYMQYTKGYTLEDIDYLICHCNEATSFGWSNPHSWTETEMADLSKYALPVPEKLTCPNCVNCEALTTADEALESIFGSEFTSSDNYQTIFTNYMNQQYGFTYGFGDYARFRDKCSGTEENPYCEIAPELLNFGEVMNLLARRGQLISGTGINLVTENIVYKSGTLRAYLGKENYSSHISGNTLLIDFGTGEDICEMGIVLPDDPGFEFSDIIGFESIQPNSHFCDVNNDFKIGARYIQCGEIKFAQLTGYTGCFPVSTCYCNPSGLTLCGESVTDGITADLAPCYEPELSQIISLATEQYETAMETAYTEFVAQYMSNCSAAFATEEIDRTGTFNQYQYTLFYYDQAGNLVKTVAPLGVTPLTGTALTNVVTSRNGTTDIDHQQTPVLPAHTYLTEYKYNSYGKITEMVSPDVVGETKYWYDRFGRLVASQNPVQHTANKYAYVLYDKFGRRKETGIVSKLTDPAEADIKANDQGALFETWVKFTGASSTTRTEVVLTYYDKSVSTFAGKFKSGQQNLRLRVATVLQLASCTNSTDPFTAYESAIHYSYDLHGNVIETLQDVPMMAPVHQDVKSTRYEFELISGNVKKVKYQEEEYNSTNTTWEPGRDRMTHEYKYDRLNRLTEVHTTTDGGVHKNRDAHYFYFDYGPLARTELGQHKVQGNDYTYTLQGWIKGMNSNGLNKEYDPGKDGTSGYLSTTSTVHESFGHDVVGYTLGYYQGDYRSIGFTEFESVLSSGSAFVGALKDLFNGNIAHTVTSIEGFSTQGSAYHYDQLQRLTAATIYEGGNVSALNNWSGSAALAAYVSSYSYDGNGNLKTLTRKGNDATNSYGMDDFTYQYTTGMNRLNYVTDAASAANTTYSDDINSGQSSGNYVYDELGQLIQDSQEGIRLNWRFGNKKLAYQENATTHVDYIYNPLGQRIVKIQKSMTSGIPTGQSSTYSWTYTYYAYDANGQVMSTYTVTMNNAATFKNIANVDEQMIYGGARIGLRQEAIRLYKDGYNALIGPKYSNQLGYKNYELTNHLGNVNAAITDRKVLDPDYTTGVWYDFTSSTPTWTTFSGSPNISLSSGNLQFGTTTATTAASYRSETVTLTSPASYTFSLDIVNLSTVSNFSVELYTNTSNTLTGATSVKTFTSSELANGTTIRYTQAFPTGTTYFFYKLVKASTEIARVKVDNLKFGKAVSRYKAVVVMKADYYPFGMPMPGRTYNNGNYRYGYSGKEQDPELKGNGNNYNFGERQYDPRLGRWTSLDPLKRMYPGSSPYSYALNSPISGIDPDGRFTIFINGFTGGVYAVNDPNMRSLPGREYWKSEGTVGDPFIEAAQKYLKDEGGMVDFKDGSEGVWGFSSAKSRLLNGYEQGIKDAKDIIEYLEAHEDEKLNIVSHSMGAAYAEGYINALVDAGVPLDRINKIVHLSAADPTDISISNKTSKIKRVQLGVDQDYTLFLIKPNQNPALADIQPKDPNTKGKDRMIDNVDVYGEISANGPKMLNYDYLKDPFKRTLLESNYDYHAYTKWNPKVFEALQELENAELVSQTTIKSSSHKRTFYSISFGKKMFDWNAIKRDGKIYIENTQSDGSGSVFQGERIECED